jgi:hypothetical protein
MKADALPATKGADTFRRAGTSFQEATGQSLLWWAVIAALHFAAQIVFRRELRPGEFGTLNTALAIVGLMTVPALAVHQAINHYLAQDHPAGRQDRIDALRTGALFITETFTWAWGVISVPVLFLLAAMLELPSSRFPLHIFVLLNILIALGGVISERICQSRQQTNLWVWLVMAAALARVALGVGLTRYAPLAAAALTAVLLAGLITLAPALRQAETKMDLRLKACAAAWDRDFLLYVGATLSVLLSLFLFSSADRLVAQSWFGVPHNNIGYVDLDMFDSYHTAGLLGRGLLWGAQPLLWMLFAQRSRLKRTTLASLTYLWIYIGALLVGAILLELLRYPLSRLFCGEQYDTTDLQIPNFVLAMIPLGLLQAVGVFSLASRRYPECFLLGGSGVAYLLLLYFVGRRPELMPAYMFAGGLVALMAVLFVGIVRWGRKQP